MPSHFIAFEFSIADYNTNQSVIGSWPALVQIGFWASLFKGMEPSSSEGDVGEATRRRHMASTSIAESAASAEATGGSPQRGFRHGTHSASQPAIQQVGLPQTDPSDEGKARHTSVMRNMEATGDPTAARPMAAKKISFAQLPHRPDQQSEDRQADLAENLVEMDEKIINRRSSMPEFGSPRPSVMIRRMTDPDSYELDPEKQTRPARITFIDSTASVALKMTQDGETDADKSNDTTRNVVEASILKIAPNAPSVADATSAKPMDDGASASSTAAAEVADTKEERGTKEKSAKIKRGTVKDMLQKRRKRQAKAALEFDQKLLKAHRLMMDEQKKYYENRIRALKQKKTNASSAEKEKNELETEERITISRDQDPQQKENVHQVAPISASGEALIKQLQDQLASQKNHYEAQLKSLLHQDVTLLQDQVTQLSDENKQLRMDNTRLTQEKSQLERQLKDEQTNLSNEKQARANETQAIEELHIAEFEELEKEHTQFVTNLVESYQREVDSLREELSTSRRESGEALRDLSELRAARNFEEDVSSSSNRVAVSDAIDREGDRMLRSMMNARLNAVGQAPDARGEAQAAGGANREAVAAAAFSRGVHPILPQGATAPVRGLKRPASQMSGFGGQQGGSGTKIPEEIEIPKFYSEHSIADAPVAVPTLLPRTSAPLAPISGAPSVPLSGAPSAPTANVPSAPSAPPQGAPLASLAAAPIVVPQVRRVPYVAPPGITPLPRTQPQPQYQPRVVPHSRVPMRSIPGGILPDISQPLNKDLPTKAATNAFTTTGGTAAAVNPSPPVAAFQGRQHPDKVAAIGPNAVKYLNHWVASHFQNPIPNDQEMEKIMKDTGITKYQLDEFFNQFRKKDVPTLRISGANQPASSMPGQTAASANPSLPRAIAPTFPASAASEDTSSQKPSSKSTKKTNLPREVVDYLKAWISSPEHCDHPYPTDEEKAQIMRDTNLELSQVNTWFVNNRKRFWKTHVKPRVDELKSGLDTADDTKDKKK